MPRPRLREDPLKHRIALRGALAACCYLMAFPLQAGIFISEFMAQNTRGLQDSDGDTSDWIELHNPDALPVDLAGYRLTDDVSDPMKWVLPSFTLEPGAYFIIFASGKNRVDTNQALHANFAILADGEHLGLIDPQGTTLQAYNPSFPPQIPDIAFGRPSGVSTSKFLTPSTPGTINPNHGFDGKLDDVEFSHPSGYYSRQLPLQLRASDPTATIYYTMDGTVPTRLSSRRYVAAHLIHETAIVRAIAFREGSLPSEVQTRSFLIAGDIKNQPDMSQEVVSDPGSRTMTDELQSLPVMSLVVKDADFFGPNGIYVNFNERGADAEVPVAIDYFNPADRADQFHVNGGIRIHGGQARTHQKKPMRLYFRSEYGPGRLNHPLFEGSPVESFDQLLLRGGGHDAWTSDWGGGRNDLTDSASYLRDQFIRQSEIDMGMLSPHGKYVQLFINGAYHGLYNLHERVDETYYADHQGGQAEDWDVIAAAGEVVSGHSDDWSEFQGLAGEGVSDAIAFAQMQRYLDMSSFADAMSSRIWSGDHDWLGPTYLGTFQISGDNNRNWFSGRQSRNNGGMAPFLFHSWDAEISMGNDRFLFSGNRETSFDLSRVNSTQSAGAPYAALLGYEEFRIAFADRLRRHFGAGGALSQAANQARLDTLAETIRPALTAESARWGHIHGGTPLLRDVEWESEYAWLRNTFLTTRNNLVLQQFRNRGLLSPLEAPAASLPGGHYMDPQALTLSVSSNAPDGIFYYTLDGSDPRQARHTDLTVLIDGYSPASVLIPSAANGGDTLSDTWKQLAPPANQANWRDGLTGIGYEISGGNYRNMIRTDVGSEMAGIAGSAFVRMRFFIDSQEQIDRYEQLILKMRYDDGYVAYLNGTEVARRNAPTTLAWDSFSSGDHPDTSSEQYERAMIAAGPSLLRVGDNILAIHGLNIAVNSSDFLIMPQLLASGPEQAPGIASAALMYDGPITLTESANLAARFQSTTGLWSPITEVAYALGLPTASKDNLLISEIHYHPLPASSPSEVALGVDDTAFEFLELRNTGEETISLNQLAFTEGIHFNFDQGEIHELPAGEHLLLVKDLDAFVARYGAAASNRVAGVFENGTSLSNKGETIILTAKGTPICSVTYADRMPWPSTPDGDGYSLALRAPLANPDLDDPDSWAASPILHGSPGIDNQDTDNDQIGDAWELEHFGTLARDGRGDLDGDGLENLQEFMLGTSPIASDSDGDRLADHLEVNIFHTDPTRADIDEDGLNDADELMLGLDPFAEDTDLDGLNDGEEVAAGSNGKKVDTDLDHFSDLLEVLRGTNPMDPLNQPLSRPEDLSVYSSFEPDAVQLPTILNLASSLDGTLFGINSSFVTGDFTPTALQLDPGGEPSGVSYPETGAPGLGTLTLSCWFSSSHSVTGLQTIVSKGYAETNRPGWKVFLDQDTLHCRVTTDRHELFEATYTGMSTGVTYHLAFVIDSDTGGIRTWLDGSSSGWDFSQAALPQGSLIDSASPLLIGANAERTEGFSGTMDEFTIWHFALGENELNRIYLGGRDGRSPLDASGPNDDTDFDGLPDAWEITHFGALTETAIADPDLDNLTNAEEFTLGTNPLAPDSDDDGLNDDDEIAQGRDPILSGLASAQATLSNGLLTYSPMDVNRVTILTTPGKVFDLSQPPEHGTINGPFSFTTGAVEQALRSEGGVVTYGDVHDPGNASYSVSLWARPEGMTAGSTQRIAGKGTINEDGVASGWNLVLFGNQFGACGGTADGQTWSIRNDLPTAGTAALPGHWHHLTLTIDRTNETVQLQVNNIEVGRTALPSGVSLANAHPLMIGFENPFAFGPQRFQGAVDELAIWNRVLVPLEQAALYRSGILQQDLATLSGSAEAPQIVVGPEAGLSRVMLPSDAIPIMASITNLGSGPLYWIAELNHVEATPLEVVLSSLNANFGTITDAFRGTYLFGEGQTGNAIIDGGRDMFDGGNILGTDLGSQIPYSNTQVSSSTALGLGGRYFTRKYNGLFVFAADVHGLETFQISGDLGADGAGMAEAQIFEATRGSRRFTGYAKRVYDAVDPNIAIADPSINHLIIVESDDQVIHSISQNTNDDFHQLAGLGEVTRIYYLLFATTDGRRVSDEEYQAVMNTFLAAINERADWLGFDGPTSGILAANETVDLPLNLIGSRTASGQNLERSLQIYSNDPLRSFIEIPYSVYIKAPPYFNASPFMVGPEDTTLTTSLVGFADDIEDGPDTLTWRFETLPEEAIVDTLSLDTATLELSLNPFPDAAGFSGFFAIVTDSDGLASTGTVSVFVTELPDPIRSTQPVELDIPDLETGRVFEVSSILYDPDLNDRSTYRLISYSRPNLFSRFEFNPTNGDLRMEYLPFASGTSLVTIAANSSDGTSATNTFSVIVNPEPPINLDVQTAFQAATIPLQILTIRNDAGHPLQTLEVDIQIMPDALRPLNASILHPDGSAVMFYHHPIASGETIVMTIAYRTDFSSPPTLQFRASPRSSAFLYPDTMPKLKEVFQREDGSFAFAFPSQPGRYHQIEYADQPGNWIPAYRLPPAGTRIYWQDDGPPMTAEHPAGATRRIYRLKIEE